MCNLYIDKATLTGCLKYPTSIPGKFLACYFLKFEDLKKEIEQTM